MTDVQDIRKSVVALLKTSRWLDGQSWKLLNRAKEDLAWAERRAVDSNSSGIDKGVKEDMEFVVSQHRIADTALREASIRLTRMDAWIGDGED